MEFFPRPIMTAEDFRLLKEYVEDNFGVLIDSGKAGFLAHKLLDRLHDLRLSSYSDYYLYLKFSPASATEQLKLISLITNNETYFFREDAQLTVFAESTLADLKESKLARGSRRVRIVSAGCSTGEEVYTLAMLLIESGLFIWDWDVRITGIDIDPHVIARAREGIYSGRSFQVMPEHFRDRYFSTAGKGLQVRDVVRSMTDFVQGNLLSLEAELPAEDTDIIFCRNVLIYFSDETIERIIAGFERVSRPEGYLFLGHSESLSRVTTAYLPVRYPGAIIYRLGEKEGRCLP